MFLKLKPLEESEVKLTEGERENELGMLRSFLDSQVNKIQKREFIRQAKSCEVKAYQHLYAQSYDKAAYYSGKAAGWRESANATEYMVKFNSTLLGKITYRTCETCGNIVKNLRDKIGGIANAAFR